MIDMTLVDLFPPLSLFETRSHIAHLSNNCHNILMSNTNISGLFSKV